MNEIHKIDDINKPLLQFLNLNVAHPQNALAPILSGIDFVVNAGQMLAIIGPNGAGKSSLLKAILNLIEFNVDKASLNGHELTNLNEKSRAQLLSYVPQFISTINNVSVYEWCKMARFSHQRLGFSLSDKDKQAIDYAIKACDLERLKDSSMLALSGGEHQRALIAGALAQDAKIILLDEPCSHLDPAHAIEILNLLKKLNLENKQTIICVSHDINQVYQYFDYIFALKSGCRLFSGETKKELTVATLKSLYQHDFVCLNHKSTQLFMPLMGVMLDEN